MLTLTLILFSLVVLVTIFNHIYSRANKSQLKVLDKILKYLFVICGFFAIAIAGLIIISLLSESLRFFQKIPFTNFLFGTKWSPQSMEHFALLPVLTGTLLITLIAMLIAVPLGLMSAIYLSEYSTKRFKNIVKPILEILAGVPTVVYGFFAATAFAPFLKDLAEYFGFSIALESALTAGIVMGIMIIPLVMSLSEDIIQAVPHNLREASIGLGSTKSESIKKVVIPAALPGIMGSVLLAISRAIGETMIVVMAAGTAANLTLNPFEAVTTMTVQIVTLLTGDTEFDNAKTLSAFALALSLFFITLIINFVAISIVKKYREAYE